MFAFIGMLGPVELLFLLVLVLMLFGAGKIPAVMKQFGQSVRALREGVNADED